MGVGAPVTCNDCCIKVQAVLSDVMGPNNPTGITLETNGFLDYLTSSAARVGAQITAQDNAGKTQKVQIKYNPRQCSPANAAASDPCFDPTAIKETPNDTCVDFTVDCVQSVNFAFSLNEMRDFCEGSNAFLDRRVAEKVADLKKAVNEDIIAKAIAGLGNYFAEPGAPLVNSVAAPKVLNLFNAQGQPNAMGLWPLLKDYRRSGWSGAPVVFGGQTFDAWEMAVNIFRGNLDGRDAARAPQVNIRTDYAIDQIFADGLEHVLVMFPGAMQLVEVYDNPARTVYEEFREDRTFTTLTVGDFTFDYFARYDECNRCWAITLQKKYDIFKMPDTALSGDCGQFSNGCLNYLVDCGDLDCNYIKC